MSFSRPNWAQIDLAALRHNARILAKYTAPARLIAVIKAGAYGHGAVESAHALRDMPEIAMLAVASVDEAIKLRESGIQTPILLLSALLTCEMDEVVHYDLTPTIWTIELAEALNNAAEKAGRCVQVHFKVDTGMGRLGESWSTATQAFQCLSTYSHLDINGIYTHFARADEESDFTALQLSRFNEVLTQISPRKSILKHASNSAALLRFPKARFDLVRPGLVLYGVNPCPHLSPDLDLLPVMTWKALITTIKTIPKGQSISYGATWSATHNSKIAVLPAGYADGYLRSLSNRGEVLLNGSRVPVIGRVTMDQIMIDVTGVLARIGDEVTLFGQHLPVEEVALQAGTIPYEMLCSVSSRVPRVYTN